jgi:cyclase
MDVRSDGVVVKGTSFQNLQTIGDPLVLAKRYEYEGADELVFLDINTTDECRSFMLNLISRIAREISIPFTVGGGIRSINDIRQIIKNGADKISINRPAIENPHLISEAARVFGSQCVVVAIDAKRVGTSYEAFVSAGQKPTGLDAVSWAKEVALKGAGEILLTSIDRDGKKSGYDIELTRRVSEAVSIPVIASGGAGSMDDFVDVFKDGSADAALAATLFHTGTLSIPTLKTYCTAAGLEMRTL